MTRFYRAYGSTSSEQVLHRLCTRSFLTLWSYANVYRDQGAKAGSAGKELCDLLVVFGDDIVIFSDKSCAYPQHADPRVSWSRWYDRAIARSARQIYGAERWIRQHPDRVFLDPACTVPFPWPLPTNPRIHRVVVATGAASQIAARGAPYGLCIEPDIVGEQHAEGAPPFHVGQVDPSRGFVHVLDEWSAALLTSHLDTAPDFIDYLAAKEAFINSGRLLIAPNEACLLAVYLSGSARERHHFPKLKTGQAIAIDDAMWDDFARGGNLKRKGEADKISYLWDALIDKFTANLEAQGLVGPSGNDPNSVEPALRELAGERRVVRRQLAKALLEVRERAANGRQDYALRTVLPSDPRPESVYILIAFHRRELTDTVYRHQRRTLLHACALVTKSRFQSVTRVVGIALEPEGYAESSEDLLIFRPDGWSAEQQADAERLRVTMGLGARLDKKSFIDWEFPRRVAKSPDDRRKERNRRKNEKATRRIANKKKGTRRSR